MIPPGKNLHRGQDDTAALKEVEKLQEQRLPIYTEDKEEIIERWPLEIAQVSYASIYFNIPPPFLLRLPFVFNPIHACEIAHTK